ncbi:hypothetical protein Q7C36_003549 [Tachysurus vachellii]|uniref:E3 ubiquitin/ISG15 ligase TRIM25-like n=1 Tax=Tachysurus vachellii TaxID=175792 RepID=A0AA88NWL7_TACVA|nr:E3 ubiquitin/ISG15 ligase TRIM25-like [Tachysurus vachellii]KAK2864395.1 hypothetical protein Q7C36_003549 [Tachysurus vachellii]
MAESLLQDDDQYNCSVCLELMKDPVTIPCGHSYCMTCINEYWKQNQLRKTQCPQCRHEFPTRPALNKNTLLAEILEKLRTPKFQGSFPALGEVECDFCTGRKLRAVRSCLQCQASYCDMHLQPHYNVPALKKHKLVNATEIPTCPRHDKLLEAFCRTDNMCICMSCVMDEHKGHNTVSSAEEREEKQIILQANKHKFEEKRQEKLKKLDELMKATEAHAQATQQSVDDIDQAFNSLIASLEKSYLELIMKIRDQEKIYMDQAAYLQEQLELQIATLMGQEDFIDNLLAKEDNVQFLQNFESMPTPSADEESSCHTLEPLDFFNDASDMISEFKEKLDDFCTQELDNMFAKHTCHIKIGDRVRVKSSVKTPKFNWGCTVTHKSVGVVKSVNDETLIVDFEDHKNWKGLLSEMERVTVADESGISAQQRSIKIGDRVRVKPSVKNPKQGWGRVTHQSVGVVKGLSEDEITVDFPEHSDWMGSVSEIEITS